MPRRFGRSLSGVIAGTLALVACSSDAGRAPIPASAISDAPLLLTRRFPAGDAGPRFRGCVYASPQAIEEPAGRRVLVVDGAGDVTALDPRTGATLWSVALPAPAGEASMAVSTPVVVGRKLVVGYHTHAASTRLHVAEDRLRHRVAVVDLDAHALDPAYPVVEMAATIDGRFGKVVFDPRHAMNRGALAHAVPAGATDGRVYVPYGNVRSLQPYHGWIFELDLDAWRAGGAAAAISGVRTTTEDVDCGPEGGDGARDAKCGGGSWSASGPLLVPGGPAGYRVVVPSGNGQLDPARGDYANTLMRMGPGLTFEPGCDPVACREFSMENLVSGCADSCRDVFLPRLLPGEAIPRPPSSICDGKGLYACWVVLDQLDAGSTPALVTLPSGKRVLAYPTKDGHVWLVDEEHLGKVYAHQKLTELCGAPGEPCDWDWSGTIVTKPAVTRIGDDAAIVVPTFVPDTTHPAGVVALRIVEREGTVRFEPGWQFPPADDAAAVERFRRHPSRATLAPIATAGGVEEHAFVVDVAAPNRIGTLYALRVRDGRAAAEVDLVGPGYRFAAPLYEDGAVFVPSCDSDVGPGTVEAYDVKAR